MQNDYFIEKRRLPVQIELTSGERLEGEIFIQSSWRGPAMLEDAPEYLNSSEPFFPLKAGGGTRLVARRQVVLLKAPPPDFNRDESLLGVPAVVSLRLSTGTVV